MSHQDKDSLENFFRERTQRHNLEFNEGDWLKLEKQLDREMPVAFTFFSWLKRFWIIPLLLAVVPIAWISYHYINMDGEIIESASIDTSKKTTDEVIIKSDNPVHESNNSATTNHASKAQPLFEAELARETNSRSESDEDDTNNSSGASDLIPNTKSEESSKSFVEPNEANFKNIGKVVLEEGAETDRHIGSRQLLFLSAIPPDYTIGPGVHEVKGIEETLEVLPYTKNKTFFKLGVGYSPDLSTVGIGNFASPGSRWAIVGEIGFANRFVLNTGFVYVNNKYKAYGEDYHAPPRYWKKGIIADEAYGECQMIDIPLNIRYNLIQKERDKLFISAGASTYFVTKEDYDFYYEIEDPELPTHWGTDKTTIYPFGIINFSIGFEHDFTQRSGVQIEPFIKIPTTGIGWGNVDLHTFGIYFLYKYKL